MAEFEVETPDGTIFVGPTQEAALAAARNHLQSSSLESVVSDLPGGGYTPPRTAIDKDNEHQAGLAQAYRNIADLPLGMLKSLGRNAIGGVQAVAKAGAATGAPGDPTATLETLQAGRDALAPSSPGEERAAQIERLLEFFVPTPGKATGLASIAKAALESGVVGSAQKGEVNPEAAVGGAAGAGIGQVASKALGSVAQKLLKGGREQLARLARPGVGYHGEKTAKAAEEALEAGDVAGGVLPGADTLVERSAARAEKLKGGRDAYRAATDQAPVDPAELAQKLLDEADKQVRVGAGGQDYVIDKARYDQLRKLADELLESRRGIPPSRMATVPLGDMEDKLQAWQGRVYDKADPSKVPTEEGTRILRQGISEASPLDRDAAMGAYSRGLELAENLKDAMEAQKLRNPSHAGEQFAVRGVLGAGLGALGGTEGSVAGATLGVASVAISRFLSSPAWQAMSAQQKYNLGRVFVSAAPELEPLISRALRPMASEQHTDQSNQSAIRYLLSKLNLKTPEAPRD